MKIQTIIIGFLLLYIPTFSQTKIDEYVSIKMPETVQKMDTVTANASVSSFYSNSKAESYFVMRMAVISNGNEVNGLPEDLTGLKKIYHQVIGDQINSMGKRGFLLLDTQEVKIRDYFAYKITYRTIDSQIESGETLLLCLNGVIYVFTYSRVGDYVVRHKEEFQKSITINSLGKQIADAPVHSESTFSVTSLVTYGIIAIVLLVFFFKKSRDKSNLGINLNRVYCPKCQTKQPFIRKPANQRQALYGGHTCNNCNTEMDKYGVAIDSKSDDYAE